MNQKSNYDPEKHHRRSIRLKGYDYAQAGLYFLTICCFKHKHLFGRIVVEASADAHPAHNTNADTRVGRPKKRAAKMMLNEAGKIAQACWLEIPAHFPNVRLHEFIVMPNHVHGIVEFVEVQNEDNQHETAIKQENQEADRDEDVKETLLGLAAKNSKPMPRSPSKTVGSVVRGFKIGVTKWFRQNTKIEDVWHRNYYEIIVRNQQSYMQISEYIINNPSKWAEDKFFTKS